MISMSVFLYAYHFSFVPHSSIPPSMKSVVNLFEAACSLKLTWLRVINLVLVFSLITQTDGAFSRVGNRELC